MKPNLRVCLVVAITYVAYSTSAWAEGRTIRRPVSDWISAQGSCSSFPTQFFGGNYLGWTARPSPSSDLDVAVTIDYAGLESNPTITGTVTERVIGTDRTLVKVKVVARGALARVQTYDPVTFTNGDVIFTSDSATPLSRRNTSSLARRALRWRICSPHSSTS